MGCGEPGHFEKQTESKKRLSYGSLFLLTTKGTPAKFAWAGEDHKGLTENAYSAVSPKSKWIWGRCPKDRGGNTAIPHPHRTIDEITGFDHDL